MPKLRPKRIKINGMQVLSIGFTIANSFCISNPFEWNFLLSSDALLLGITAVSALWGLLASL